MSCLPQADRHQVVSTSKSDQGRKPLPSITTRLEVGFVFKGSCGGEECDDGGVGFRGTSNIDGGVDGQMLYSEAIGESASELVGNVSTECDVVLMGEADHGVADTKCMELEEGGHASISC